MIEILTLGCVLIASGLIIFRPHEEARGFALGLVIILTFFGTRVQSDKTGGFVFTGALVVLALAICRARPIAQGGGRASLTRSILPLSYFVLAALVTASANDSALNLYLRSFLFVALALLAAAGASRRDIRIIYAALVLNGIIQVLMAVLEVAQSEPFWGYAMNRAGTGDFVQANELFTTTIPRIEGSTGHSIMFGIAMALAAISTFLLIAPRPLRAAVCAAPFVVGIAFSGSRSTVLALGIVLIYAFFLRTTHMNFALRIGGLSLMAGLALVGSGYFRNLLEVFTASGSFTNRIEGLSSASALIGRNLAEAAFGSGIGSEDSLFNRGFLQQSNDFRTVDNQFVTSLATVGGIGFLVLLLAIIVAWRRGPRSMRPLLLFFVTMFFSFDALNWFSSLIVVSILLAARGESDDAPTPEQPATRPEPTAFHARRTMGPAARTPRTPAHAFRPRTEYERSNR